MPRVTLLSAIRDAFAYAMRNGFFGFLIGIGLIEGLAALLNKESITSFQSLMNTPTYTLFVHVTAGLFAVTLALLCIVWTAAMRALRGALKGVNEAADALDGPARHGLF